MVRYLRISVIVACAAACVLAFALWIRTGFSCDTIHGPLPRNCSFVVTARQGGLSLGFVPQSSLDWGTHSLSRDTVPDLPYKSALGFGIASTPTRVAFRSPFWSHMLVTGSIAGILLGKMPYRFSLQTMLVAMTLIAVLLGIIAAAR